MTSPLKMPAAGRQLPQSAAGSMDAGLRDEVLRGLRATPKTLPPKLFYDAAGADASATTRAMDTMHEWFAEQLGIQPVFYGMEHDPAAFFAAVDELARAHRDEWVAMIACAYDRVASLIGPTPVAPRPIGFEELWSHWRARATEASA